MDDIQFYIPDKEKGPILVKNFFRGSNTQDSNEPVGTRDLNKSDYLYQTIILLIIKKIEQSNNDDDNLGLYKLIEDINNLLDTIFVLESYSLYEEDMEIPSAESILEESKRISLVCLEEHIFDYED